MKMQKIIKRPFNPLYVRETVRGGGGEREKPQVRRTDGVILLSP